MKIKVLYIVNHTVAYGANVALLNLLDTICELGVEPMVIVGMDGALCEQLKKRSIPSLIIKHNFNIYPRSNSYKSLIAFFPRILEMILINYNAKKKLLSVVKQFKPHLIHTNIGPTHIGYDVAQKLDIPHVWHIREYQDLDFNMKFFPSKKAFLKKLYSQNNYNIAITQALFNYFKMQKNTQVISDGLDTNLTFKDKKEKYFLFVGRLTEGKGVHNVIDAFIDISKDSRWADYKLLLAGDGVKAFTEKLYDRVKNADLLNRICFLGFRKDVYSLMANATALIVASKCEGFGLITIEAILNGCLVIGNNSGGTKEILEKENIGILYSGHEDLVKAMQTVLVNGINSYSQIIKNAQKIVTELYSKELNGKKVYNYYRDILKYE